MAEVGFQFSPSVRKDKNTKPKFNIGDRAWFQFSPSVRKDKNCTRNVRLGSILFQFSPSVRKDKNKSAYEAYKRHFGCFNSVPRLGRIKTAAVRMRSGRVVSFNSVPRLGRIKTKGVDYFAIRVYGVSIQSLG